ncbi:MAG TPA: hypothetical protein VFU50_15780 [Terriglobales bacterium]|nr:hypothetical protein [Terriglobales bacterium]
MIVGQDAHKHPFERQSKKREAQKCVDGLGRITALLPGSANEISQLGPRNLPRYVLHLDLADLIGLIVAPDAIAEGLPLIPLFAFFGDE